MIYIAMLRGINVGGRSLVKMDRLSVLFEDLGFESVKTYIQSGNVIFHAPQTPAASLVKRLESSLFKALDSPVSVVLRTSQQFVKVIKRNPFLDVKAFDPKKLHVTFLTNHPVEACSKKLGRVFSKSDQYEMLDREIYLFCPNGYGRTKLSNNAIERILEVGATTRNWNTVIRLHLLSL